MNKRSKILFILLSSIFIFFEIRIIKEGISDEDNQTFEYAIVLGTEVEDDGTASERLQARLNRCIELYTDSLINNIVVSGGLGETGFKEGDIMAAYLISKGIPKEIIEIDNKGFNTRATAVNFQKTHPNCPSYIVVSQYYHIKRIKLAFKQVGLPHAQGAHCDFYNWQDPYSLMREFFANIKYQLWY